jgi:hypothetical protein
LLSPGDRNEQDHGSQGVKAQALHLTSSVASFKVTSLCLCFLIYKMGIIIIPTRRIPKPVRKLGCLKVT